jgi:hypothetical protein
LSAGMTNTNDLLTTLSESSAVMVAIIGGFLVSRLVALLSERESIRRQSRDAQSRLKLLHGDYEAAYQYRLEWSQSYFEDLALDKIIEDPDIDIEQLIVENVPRGSSAEEIRPYAFELKSRVEAAYAALRSVLGRADDRTVDLASLKARGLRIAEEDEDLHERVLYEIKQQLPSSVGYIGSLIIPPIVSAGSRETEARRFDEAVRSESELRGRIEATETEKERLATELTHLGRPIGVISAIWMLATLSITGIVAPVIVMAFEPAELSWQLKASLIGLFVVGIAAVLAYIVWYTRKLDDD